MIVELVNTGSELMLGRVLNTHQQWLCRELADLGYPVTRQVAVADSAPAIEQAAREALSRADLVIATGGLGPTSDDLTRDAIARMLGKNLHEHADTLVAIENFLKRLKRPMPEYARLQALVPEGALVLPNPHGTAPGLAMEVRPNPFRAGGELSWLIRLPGPPRELRPMFRKSVVRLLKQALPLKIAFVCRTLRTTGIAESVVQERIEPRLRPFLETGLELGYCARPGEVDVRMVARGITAEKLVNESEEIIRRELGSSIFAASDEELETVVVRLLTELNQTVAVAESCTGGCLANRLTDVPGASAVFRMGMVPYSNEAKQKFLNVRAETLEQHGAVSENVAREMAEGVRRASGTDYGIAITGIAGPGGGSVEKPVGTVFIALSSAARTKVWRLINPWDRLTFKQVTAQQALNFLRLWLKHSG